MGKLIDKYLISLTLDAVPMTKSVTEEAMGIYQEGTALKKIVSNGSETKEVILQGIGRQGNKIRGIYKKEVLSSTLVENSYYIIQQYLIYLRDTMDINLFPYIDLVHSRGRESNSSVFEVKALKGQTYTIFGESSFPVLCEVFRDGEKKADIHIPSLQYLKGQILDEASFGVDYTDSYVTLKITANNNSRIRVLNGDYTFIELKKVGQAFKYLDANQNIVTMPSLVVDNKKIANKFFKLLLGMGISYNMNEEKFYKILEGHNWSISNWESSWKEFCKHSYDIDKFM